MRRTQAVAVVLLCVLMTRAHARTPAPPARVPVPTALAQHCYNGCPEVAAAWRRGPIVQIARAAYSLEVSTTAKVPLWVAEYVTAHEVQGDADRAGYRADPILRDEPHATVRDYRESNVKYDIGHQAPAANHQRSQKRMDQTFYLSNMAPQIPAFNRGIWRTLETRARKWITARGHAWCITGPIFFDGKKIRPDYEPKTIGENDVAVPTHFYKILIAPPRRGSNEVESIAFIFENRRYVDYDYNDHITTVKAIEDLTGINFMPRLTAAQRTRLESRKAEALW